MLETLLKHFRSYGMDDLDFIIVNSKMSHAQEKMHELTRRVSFDVYQETDEEEVWSVMEGGKDDMYIYDRCGRLTYYIPFPLSILNESPLVSNAILATYFRSPCGEKCDTNATLDIEGMVKNLESDIEDANETAQETVTYTMLTEGEQSVYATEIIEESNDESNDTASNDVFNAIDSINSNRDDFNSNSTNNITDYDYPFLTNTSNVNETKDTRIDEANVFFSRIYRLFFNHENDSDTTYENTPTNNNSLSSAIPHNQQTSTEKSTNNEVLVHDLNNHDAENHRHHKHNRTNGNNKEKKKSDRCAEADFEVCKSWSKNRLLHAQKCCSEVGRTESESGTQRSCAHFGKKRCKKIQSILKCCIKTVYTEPTTETVDRDSASGTSTMDTSTDATAERVEVRTETADVVCCRPAENGKLCRVSSSTTCEDGEQLQQSSSNLP